MTRIEERGRERMLLLKQEELAFDFDSSSDNNSRKNHSKSRSVHLRSPMLQQQRKSGKS